VEGGRIDSSNESVASEEGMDLVRRNPDVVVGGCACFLTQSKRRNDRNAMDILLAKFASNTLTEFKLGFEEGEFRSKGDVQTLIEVLQDQYLHKLSITKHLCLKSIQIGWRLPRYAVGPILQQVIPTLLQLPAKVEHLQLTLDAWVPEVQKPL
jgi:hypothetical protein